jgi:hypothetical protein
MMLTATLFNITDDGAMAAERQTGVAPRTHLALPTTRRGHGLDMAARRLS